MWLGTASHGRVDASCSGRVNRRYDCSTSMRSLYSFTGLPLGVVLPGCLNMYDRPCGCVCGR
jgi:hypothetical protein